MTRQPAASADPAPSGVGGSGAASFCFPEDFLESYCPRCGQVVMAEIISFDPYEVTLRCGRIPACGHSWSEQRLRVRKKEDTDVRT